VTGLREKLWLETVIPEGPGFRHIRRCPTGPRPTLAQLDLVKADCPPLTRITVEGGWLTLSWHDDV
jgi:hypothetical protein